MVRKFFGEKNFESEKMLNPKKCLIRKFLSQKMLGQKKNLGKKIFGKHCLCVTFSFLVFSDIADFGGVLLLTWVLRTPNPLNLAKSP